MRRLRERLTYANVMSTVAVFVALGGTSVAAVEIAKNSVTSSTIKNGQVKTKDLGRNAVTSSKVKNGSLLSRDFKAGQLPAGPKGATGPQGARGLQGPAGPSNGYFASRITDATWTISQTTLLSFTVPAGKYVVNASVDNDNSAAGTPLVGCSISVDAGQLDFVNVKPGPEGADDSQAIALTGAGTASGSSLVSLDCSASATTGFWDGASLTAIKVATLN